MDPNKSGPLVIIRKIVKISWSKLFRTTSNKSKRGKIGKIVKSWSKEFRTTGNKSKKGKKGKIGKIAKNGP